MKFNTNTLGATLKWMAWMVVFNAAAQTPSGTPIKIIVPFAAGSYTDNVIRIVTPEAALKLNIPIIIDNKPGANGIIGADFVAKSAPDGNTLLMGGASINAVNPSLFKKLPYDPVNDLIPLTRFGTLPFVLVTNPSVSVKSMVELLAHLKANPQKLAYATPNSVSLVAMETFKKGTNTDILSIPYKSSPQALLDLVSGQVQIMVSDYATAMPHINAGKLNVIAVTMNKRTPLLPNTPSISETIPGYDISAWNGLFAPKGTSPEQLERINKSFVSVLGSKTIKDKLTTIGFEINPMGPDKFGAYVEQQIKTWSELIKQTGIEPE